MQLGHQYAEYLITPLSFRYFANLTVSLVLSEVTIELAKYLKVKGVVKYSAYWCSNCLNQSELFGKQAYKELNVVECARDGKNSQTQLCIDKEIKGFPTWEINGKLILGVLSLKELSKLTGFKN